MKAIFSKCYDDWGNLKDNALNIAFNLGKKKGLRIGRKQGRADAFDEIIEYYKPCNDCCACLEEDRDYFTKKCEMDMQISYTELVEDLRQLKKQMQKGAE